MNLSELLASSREILRTLYDSLHSMRLTKHIVDYIAFSVCPTVLMSLAFRDIFRYLMIYLIKYHCFTEKFLCTYYSHLKRAGFTGNWIKLRTFMLFNIDRAV
jgi:hypothetical protein